MAANRLQAWVKLFAGLFCLWLLVFAAARLSAGAVFFERMAGASSERGIDPSAYFYSELEVSCDAERYVEAAVRRGSGGSF